MAAFPINPIIDTSVEGVVRPAARAYDDLVVLDRDARQDDPIAETAARMRAGNASADITAAVRVMYKRVGIDPTKTRPSSEALLRRVQRGDALPRVNSLVDIVNWTSLESQLPFGLYDRGRIHGAVTLRLGRPGESYAGIRKDDVHVEGRLVLADEDGAFGNPTSDSARTMVTVTTTQALVVIFAPTGVAAPDVERALQATSERIGRYCGR